MEEVDTAQANQPDKRTRSDRLCNSQDDGKRYGAHVSKDHYPYPEDEFDVLGEGRTPVGVHREPVPRWRQWLPYLLVLVLVPVLTFGVVKFFAKDTGPGPVASDAGQEQPADEPGDEDDSGADDGDATDPDDDGEADSDSDEEGEDGDDQDEDGQDDEDESDELDLDIPILVLNGARIQGFAGEVADALAAEGWTGTDPDNYTNDAPVETTLYYSSEEFADEANAVAEQLGISNVEESAASASNGIVIVLRPDFSLPG